MTKLTPDQAQTLLLKARVQRARIKVIMAANYDNRIIQAFGGFMYGLWGKAIARYEATHPTVH
jgi:hypothetical protein